MQSLTCAILTLVPKRFLHQVPTAWDDTRVLTGEPGRLVVVARRRSDAWYVGGLNGGDAARTITVDFSFLGQGSWSATIIRDGADDRIFADETRVVASKDSAHILMRGHGGFAMRLVAGNSEATYDLPSRGAMPRDGNRS
jgi:alpha-glucosidase